MSTDRLMLFTSYRYARTHLPHSSSHTAPSSRLFSTQLILHTSLLCARAQPLYRVTRLFQSMGLRWLCVVNSRYCVVGLITRIDISNLTVDTNEGPASTSKSERRMLEARHEVDRLLHADARRSRRSAPVVGEGSEMEDTLAAAAGPTKRRHSEPDALRFCGSATVGSSNSSFSMQGRGEDGVHRKRRSSFEEKLTADGRRASLMDGDDEDVLEKLNA